MFENADKTPDTAYAGARVGIKTNNIFRPVNIAANKTKFFAVSRFRRFRKITDRSAFPFPSAEFSVGIFRSPTDTGEKFFSVVFIQFANCGGDHAESISVKFVFGFITFGKIDEKTEHQALFRI